MITFQGEMWRRFLRFPGGCYVEGGDWLRDRFQWKAALGRTEDRAGHHNAVWGYWSTDGAPLFRLPCFRARAVGS